MKKTDLLILKEFLRKCNYNQEDLNYIYNNFGEMNVLCVLRQIYASINMLDNDENEYYQIFQYLQNNFDLGCNIIEIGGGHYPILSKYIDDYQRKISKGTITVYDPNLAVNKLGNIKLMKQKFKFGDDISKYDLVIAQAPCDKFDEVIASAIEENKEFFVTFCDCIREKYPQNMHYYFDEDGFDPVIEEIFSYISKKRKSDTGTIYTSDSLSGIQYFKSK